MEQWLIYNITGKAEIDYKMCGLTACKNCFPCRHTQSKNQLSYPKEIKLNNRAVFLLLSPNNSSFLSCSLLLFCQLFFFEIKKTAKRKKKKKGKQLSSISSELLS